jgi:hypothetical protein
MIDEQPEPRPGPDPSNSTPDGWTKDMTPEEQAEVVARLRAEFSKDDEECE